MKLKKILAVVLAMALLCMTFAACGDSSGSSSSSAASTGSESSATSEAGESSTADEGGSAAAGEVTLFTPKTVDASKPEHPHWHGAHRPEQPALHLRQ